MNIFNLDSYLLAMVRHKRIVRFCWVQTFLIGCETYFIAPTAWYYVKSLGQNEVLLHFSI